MKWNEIMESWNHGIMESWNHGIMESQNKNNIQPYLLYIISHPTWGVCCCLILVLRGTRRRRCRRCRRCRRRCRCRCTCSV